MNSLQTNYQALVTEENEIPHESVIFHAASEGGKPHWNHIGDLDTFFKNVYLYHQKHGFKCIILEHLKNTINPLIIIFGFAYFYHGVIFDFNSPSSPLANQTDIHLSQLFLPVSTAIANFGVWTWLMVIVGVLIGIYNVYRFWQTYSTFDDIRQFYSLAMKMDEDKVRHSTWHEVQCRLREVQHEQQMCVHKSDLTELDISHRILRHKNYLVSMINKDIIPVKFKTKFGEWNYMSSTYEKVIMLLFFSSLSPVFKETGKLDDDFKKYSKRKEAARKLQNMITIITVLCIFFMAPYLLYTSISMFLKYSPDVKYNTARLFNRHWSNYAHLYVRHFNELDHELNARLTRAYKPADDYTKSFSSPILEIIARYFLRIFGATAVFFVIWGLIEEKLFTVPGVLILVSVCYFLYFAFSSLVRDENALYFPKRLMAKIIADIHYVPDHFKANAHLPTVRDEFCQLFSYKLESILNEVFTTLALPYILYFHLRPKTLEIVDFFRNFTVDVSGVGDVCSFSLMDVSKHGNSKWHAAVHTKADQTQRAEGGKTELSLIHFTLMNPGWKPPPSSDVFITDFKQRVNVARDRQDVADPYFASLSSLSSMGSKYASLVSSIHFSHQLHPSEFHREHCIVSVPNETEEIGTMSGDLSLVEGPRYLGQGGFLSSRYGELGHSEVQADPSGLNPLEIRTADMSFSALYLHEVHQRLIESSSSSQAVHQRQPSQESGDNGNEASPLLEVQVGNYVQ